MNAIKKLPKIAIGLKVTLTTSKGLIEFTVSRVRRESILVTASEFLFAQSVSREMILKALAN